MSVHAMSGVSQHKSRLPGCEPDPPVPKAHTKRAAPYNRAARRLMAHKLPFQKLHLSVSASDTNLWLSRRVVHADFWSAQLHRSATAAPPAAATPAALPVLPAAVPQHRLLRHRPQHCLCRLLLHCSTAGCCTAAPPVPPASHRLLRRNAGCTTAAYCTTSACCTTSA